jgi:hypothetical protein
MHRKFLENAVGIGQHIHQVRDRRSLIAGHVGNTGLQEGFRNREDSFTPEFLPSPR